MLTKQQKLDILSKAIDEGADIEINFYKVSKSRAAILTTDFAETMGTSTEGKNGSGFYWYQAHAPKFKVNAFYDNKSSYMVEDVVRTIEEVEM